MEKVHPECGTKAGHDKHRRKYKDEFCQLCVDAMRQYWKDYRKRPEKKDRIRQYNRTNRPLRGGSRFKKLIKQGFDPKRDFYSVNTVINTYGTDCHLCGEAIDLDAPRLTGTPGWEKGLHIDHVLPVSRGGHDTLDNVRPSHGQCNVKKSNKLDFVISDS